MIHYITMCPWVAFGLMRRGRGRGGEWLPVIVVGAVGHVEVQCFVVVAVDDGQALQREWTSQWLGPGRQGGWARAERVAGLLKEVCMGMGAEMAGQTRWIEMCINLSANDILLFL